MWGCERWKTLYSAKRPEVFSGVETVHGMPSPGSLGVALLQ